MSHPKIVHVYDTKNNEETWDCLLSNNERCWVEKSVITKYKMITRKSTYTVVKLGPLVRFTKKKIYRVVVWQGFQPSLESRNYRL